MLEDFLNNLPEVETPKIKVPFNDRIMWTLAGITIYFVLSLIPLYGLSSAYKAQFETISILLAASFGSIITLGIGPIVTGSIILQLLQGAEIIKIDTNTKEGKKRYQGLQKLFSIFFVIFENSMYVISGALPPATPTTLNMFILILQLVIGGFILMMLDEIVSKYGFSSGISLFIAAGVSREIFVNILNPMQDPMSPGFPTGQLWKIFALISQNLPEAAIWPVITIGATVLVFVMSTYIQALTVEIPLSFGRVKGFGMRWPLKFIYTSNIPVILVAALIASMQFWGLMLYNMGIPILGTYEKVSTQSGGVREVPKSGLIYYLNPPTIREIYFSGFKLSYLLSVLIYMFFMVVGSVIFSVLWIQVGGQDPRSVANQLLSSGLMIPGFRSDPRIVEQILARYIKPLTVLGGATVGFLAAIADLLGALSRGTGILLSVMIIYGLYEDIKKNQMEDMHPFFKKLLGA